MSPCQQNTGWLFFLWLFLLFWLAGTARTRPAPPRDPVTLLPRLALIAIVCGLGTASHTLPRICKAFHLQCEQASHLICTTLKRIAYCYFKSWPLLIPKRGKKKKNQYSLSSSLLCMLLHVSITLPLLTVCSGIWQLFQQSCSDSLALAPLPFPPS